MRRVWFLKWNQQEFPGLMREPFVHKDWKSKRCFQKHKVQRVAIFSCFEISHFSSAHQA
jgi:hypothetical protein